MADEQDTKQSREEFQEARRTLVDMLVAQHPGTTHKTGDGIAIAELADHFKTAAEQAVNADREAAARALNMTPEEFDAFKAQRAAGGEGSTPQERTASLPAGTTPTLPKPQTTEDSDRGPLSGTDLLEDAARDFLADFGKR